MDSGTIASIVAIIGTIFTFLGITGVDAGLISQVISGGIALVTVGAAVWSHYKRPTA